MARGRNFKTALSATDSSAHQAVDRLRRTSSANLVGRINRLKAADLALLSEKQVENRIGRLMDGYSTKPAILETNGVFRARKNPSTSQSFQNASELWYPPSGVIKESGRFNRAGQSTFYVSSKIEAAFLEINCQVGDKITLLFCPTKNTSPQISCAHIGLQRTLNAQSSFGPDWNHLRDDPRFLNDLDDMGVSQKWLRLDDYFSELGTARVEANYAPHHYKMTNAIGEILRRIGPTQALHYPSVATGLRAFNLNFLPEEADKLFFPFEAWEFSILAHQNELALAPQSDSGYFKMKVVRCSEGIDHNGTIIWANSLPTDTAQSIQSMFGRAEEFKSELQ